MILIMLRGVWEDEVMSEGIWYEPYLAPGIVVTIILFVAAGIVKYLEGKKSNIKEAKDLEDKTIEKAVEKTRQEKSDAKVLDVEKTQAASVLKEDAEKEAIKVKKESREHIDTKFRFSDQEHAHQHSDLTNKIKNLDTKIEQVIKDLRAHIKSQDEKST
jgi:organic radical activating enzyme